jgi:hypothetical protein
MTKQAQDIEKYKRNMAKLQKENAQILAGVRNMSKAGAGSARGGARRRGAAGSNLRNTVIGSGGLLEEGGAFQHSFKKSFNMASGPADLQSLTKRASTDLFGGAFEEEMKQFQEKFMENLTASLTKQLGFELK